MQLNTIHCGDCLELLAQVPEQSIGLVFGSPPYTGQRKYLEVGWRGGNPDCKHSVIPGPVTEKYGICRCGAQSFGEDLNIARDVDEWVAWMLRVFKASLRVCKGLVAFVVDDATKNYRYQGGPILLWAELIRAGICTRKAPVYHRVGIPGSGGPDWFRSDYEFVLCATNGGRLAWSDNKACGSPPKYGPGGVISHRLADGTRANEKKMRQLVEQGGVSQREAARQTGTPFKTTTSGIGDNGTSTVKTYIPPEKANPGNVVEETYTFTATQLDEILANYERGDWIHCAIGGGKIGSRLAHENEAPFPEVLAERFIRSFCPEGGTVLDPFSGSGTTCSVAARHRRNFLGFDLRQSQVDLSKKRVSQEQPLLF